MSHSPGITISPRGRSRSRRYSYLWAAGLFGLGFVLLGVVGGLRWLWGLDLRLVLAGHFDAPCWALNASEAASPLVAGEVSLLYAGALAIWCLWHRRPWLGVWLVGLLFAIVAVEFAFKFAFGQPTPDSVLGD